VKHIQSVFAESSSNSIRKKSQLKKQEQSQAHSNIKLSLLGVGLVFGDDDILTNRPYKASLKCVRNDSVVFLLQRDEFLRIFRTENETWNLQFGLSQKKEIADLQMTQNFERI
jgi:CRP-like cAMP-binding protein